MQGEYEHLLTITSCFDAACGKIATAFVDEISLSLLYVISAYFGGRLRNNLA